MTSLRKSCLVIVLATLCWSTGLAVAQTPKQPGGALENPLAAHSLEAMSATRERPLFSPSRRPPPPPMPPKVNVHVAPPPPAPPNVTLYGTVLEGNEAHAIVRVGSQSELVRLRFGQQINGWKVAQIEARKLVLALGNRLATFTLFDNQDHGRPHGPVPSQSVHRPGPNQSPAKNLGSGPKK